jgi:hypothetical protein
LSLTQVCAIAFPVLLEKLPFVHVIYWKQVKMSITAVDHLHEQGDHGSPLGPHLFSLMLSSN